MLQIIQKHLIRQHWTAIANFSSNARAARYTGYRDLEQYTEIHLEEGTFLVEATALAKEIRDASITAFMLESFKQ